jgi:hypothetical protein
MGLPVLELVVTMLVALPVLFLWLALVSLLVRPFGVRLPLAPLSFAKRRSAFQSLTFYQYLMVYGILCFGCGMLIMTTLSRYLEWKYWHGSPLTSENFLRASLEYPLLAGVLFGLISWSTKSG